MKLFKQLLDFVAGFAAPNITKRNIPEGHPYHDSSGYLGACVNRDWALCTTSQRMWVLTVILGMLLVAAFLLLIVYALFVWIPVVMLTITFLAGGMYLIAKKVK